MLKRHPTRSVQAGFSLIVSLVALVIMALAAVSLMRTVSTSTLVSGNLAYEQAAVTGADVAIENAIAWLENNSGQATSASAVACTGAGQSTVLACDQPAQGYVSSRTDPSGTQTWATVFGALQAGPVNATPKSFTDGATTRNTAAYLIQRMCATSGDAGAANGCSSAPASAECGSSKSSASNAGAGNLKCASPTYYRITVQVTGPRNTTAYVQAMVAL